MKATAVATTLLLSFTLVPGAWPQPAANAGWVVLPLEEYRTLRDRAFPQAKGPDAPPVAAAVSRVDYDLEISGENAVGRATVTIDVLADGWVRVPIPPGL